MKKIIWYVLSIHLFFVFWAALWLPSKKISKKPLKIRTIAYKPPPPPKLETTIAKNNQTSKSISTPTPIVKKPVVNKPAVKKSVIKKAPPSLPPKIQSIKKNPVIPQNLQQQLQESIAKIEQKSHKESPKKILQAPSFIPHLKIDEGVEEDESAFALALVQCLQSALNLPEIGAVKVELTLRCNGSFVKMRILESKSERNKMFLEEELQMLKFPSFSGGLKNEKEHAFVITFCNS